MAPEGALVDVSSEIDAVDALEEDAVDAIKGDGNEIGLDFEADDDDTLAEMQEDELDHVDGEENEDDDEDDA